MIFDVEEAIGFIMRILLDFCDTGKFERQM